MIISNIFIILCFAHTDIVSSEENNSVKFRFKDNVGDLYVINGQSEVQSFKFNRSLGIKRTKWISKQKAKKKVNNYLLFSYYYKSTRRNRTITEGNGEFKRNSLGQMQSSALSFFPQSLGSPSFSKDAKKVNHFWERPGIEKIDFRKIGIPNPINIRFNARYRYLGNKVLNGKKVALIQEFYISNLNFNKRIYIPLSRMYHPIRRLIPARLIGYYERLFYWDNEAGYWKKMTAKINFILAFTNGTIFEWKGKVMATMKKVSR